MQKHIDRVYDWAMPSYWRAVVVVVGPGLVVGTVIVTLLRLFG